ncbi:MAG TPA: hypothetical protein VGJ53_04810 [Micromonosporaceae bacterium]|jgi:hypothetical protein
MRITRALMPLALAGVVLAGCGGDGNRPSATTTTKSPAPTDNGVSALAPNEIVQKSIAALEGAKSYQMKGDIYSDGQQMYLHFKVSGKDLIGVIASQGTKVELLSVGGQNFVRPDEAFWKANAGDAGATIAKLLGSRWAKLSATDKDFRTLFKIIEPSELLKPTGRLTKATTKQVPGGTAIGVVQSGADGGTLWVATIGEPYPLFLEGSGGKGHITFTSFGGSFPDIALPAASEVVDLDKLKSGS